MLLFPCCKINIGLDIVSRRPDGYHEVDTLMYPLRDICDGLEVLRGDSDGVEFSSSGLTVDCAPEKNLVVKAWELMRSRYGVGGVKVHLHKAIPFGAGLGGGSADAAFMLTGLNSLFALGLTDDELEELASHTGSDTPFFVRSRPRFCRGRGEVMSPAGIALAGKWCVVVKPPLGISTAEAYSGVVPSKPTVPLRERLAGPVAEWRDTVSNAFEDSLFPKYPVLAAIKEMLYDSGALYASMSGSGSAVYGIFDEVPPLDRTDGNTYLVSRM